LPGFLEQINRRLEVKKQAFDATRSQQIIKMVKNHKAAKQVKTIGAPVPVDLHERMKKYLDARKKQNGEPQTLKELAVLALNAGMHLLEDAEKARKAALRPSSVQEVTETILTETDKARQTLASS
jgi:hypothetical protein